MQDTYRRPPRGSTSLGRIHTGLLSGHFAPLDAVKERMEQVRLEHLAILDRLFARDKKGAGRAMRAHMEPAAQTAMRLFHTSAASLTQDAHMQF